MCEGGQGLGICSPIRDRTAFGTHLRLDEGCALIRRRHEQVSEQGEHTPTLNPGSHLVAM